MEHNLTSYIDISRNKSLFFEIMINIYNNEEYNTKKNLNILEFRLLLTNLNYYKTIPRDIYIYKNILSSFLLNINEKIALEELYTKSKKIKNKLLFFLRSYRWKKAVTYDFNTDLYLNSLDNFPDCQKIILLENNTKYQFRLSDLVNSLTVSLTHSCGLFSKPLKLKNPHTNINFSINNLYNIYFKLLDSNFNIPLCIRGFFQCEMRTSKFLYKYFTILKEKTISNFSKSDNLYEKYEQLLNLFHDYREDIDYLTIINHPPQYIKQNLCKKLHNSLYYYLKSKHSCNPLIKKEFKIKTKTCLVKYLNKNPNFGLQRGRDIIRFIPLEDRSSLVSPPPRRLGPPPIRAPPPPPQLSPPLSRELSSLQNITQSLVRLPPINTPIQLSINDISLLTRNMVNRRLNENTNIAQMHTQSTVIHPSNNIPSILMSNPFSPNREIPRSPYSSTRPTISSNLNLFRR